MSDQRTFNSEAEIIAAIEEAQAKSTSLLRQSVELEKEALEKIRYGSDDEKDEGKDMLKESAVKERSAQTVTLELKKLKDALAAFRTEVMPLVIPEGEGQKRVVI